MWRMKNSVKRVFLVDEMNNWVNLKRQLNAIESRQSSAESGCMSKRLERYRQKKGGQRDIKKKNTKEK